MCCTCDPSLQRHNTVCFLCMFTLLYCTSLCSGMLYWRKLALQTLTLFKSVSENIPVINSFLFLLYAHLFHFSFDIFSCLCRVIFLYFCYHVCSLFFFYLFVQLLCFTVYCFMLVQHFVAFV